MEYVSSTIKNKKLYDSQRLYSGGIASNTTIFSGGSQYLYDVDTYAIGTKIKSGGIQELGYSTYTYDTVISKGGEQWVFGQSLKTTIKSGGTQYVRASGLVVSTIINNGALQYISGYGDPRAYNTIINSGGEQNIVYGNAYDTIVKNGGLQTVTKGETAVRTQIKSGGSVMVSSGGYAISATVSYGGRMTIENSAYLANITAMKGSYISMGGNYAEIYRYDNTLTSMTVSARPSSTLKVDPDSDLTLGGNVKMNNISLDVNSAKLIVKGTGNIVQNIYGSRAQTIYDVSSLNQPSTKIMLKSVDYNGFNNQNINISGQQKLGTYTLSKNVYAKFLSISVDSQSQGHVFTDGTALSINGVTYKTTYNKKSKTLNLKLSAYGNKIYIGTANNDKLTGTINSDIFYGSAGNDTISGKNGRDVALYNTTKWGQDVIAKTDGTMTLLFNGLKESDITTKKSGTNLVITKKSDSKQKITVKNYSENTHNIIFTTNKLNAFSSYMATPGTDLMKSARSQVWSAAKLA